MKKILGMGNALVDILTPIDGDHLLEFLALPKGSMQLVDISKTAEIEEKIKNFEHTTIAGGSAANTVKCIAQLGGKAGFIGKIGNDKVGNFFEDTIKQNGITPILLKSTLPSKCTSFNSAISLFLDADPVSYMIIWFVSNIILLTSNSIHCRLRHPLQFPY